MFKNLLYYLFSTGKIVRKEEKGGEVLVENLYPAVSIGLVAILDTDELVVELSGPGSGLAILGEDILLAGVEVVDLTDGGAYGSCAASGSLLECLELVDENLTTLHFKTEILGKLSQRLVGDRGKDTVRVGSDILAVSDSEEVGGATLVEIFLLLRVDVEHHCIAEIVSLLAGYERSGIVTADFDRTCALGSYAVILSRHTDLGGLEAILEVGAYGSHEHDYHVLACGLNAYLSGDTDLKRTDIEGSACAVRGNETLVELHHLAYHLAEELYGHGLHLDTLGAADEALCVLFHTEDADFTVFAAISLQALEALLAIVEAGSGDMKGNVLGVGYHDLSPLAVLVGTTYIVVGGHIAEAKFSPIDFSLFHCD